MRAVPGGRREDVRGVVTAGKGYSERGVADVAGVRWGRERESAKRARVGGAWRVGVCRLGDLALGDLDAVRRDAFVEEAIEEESDNAVRFGE